MLSRFSDGPHRPAAFACAPATAAAPRVATSDWTVAETLTAMGHPPVGVADRRVYDTWVNYPPLPKSTLEAGLRFQPNLERLYQIKPDFFVQSPWYASAKPQFEKIAPVYEVAFGTDKRHRRTRTQVATTRKLGKIIGDAPAAEKLVADTETLFARHRAALAAYRSRPLAWCSLPTAATCVFTAKPHCFRPCSTSSACKNAWTGASNEWGFANITLPDLAKLPPDTLLIVVKPHPPNTRRILENSTLWRRLPFSRAANRRIFALSWSYGGLPAMQQFANQLGEKLPSERKSRGKPFFQAACRMALPRFGRAVRPHRRAGAAAGMDAADCPSVRRARQPADSRAYRAEQHPAAHGDGAAGRRRDGGGHHADAAADAQPAGLRQHAGGE